MKFVHIAMLLAVVPAVLSQRAESVPRVAKREALCPAKSVCDCTGIAPGLFCGDGVLGCKIGDVYQCNKDGHTTCNFGVRKTCQKCNKLSCP